MVKGIAAMVASWAFVVACSGSTGGGGGGGLTAATACADLAHQRCTQFQTCSPTVVQIRYGSESVCETRETDSCTSSLALPSQGNTPAATEACSQAYAGWACTDLLNGVNIPQACQQQTGSIADGSACAVNGQCQSGFCAIAPGSSCGTCSAAPTAGTSCAELTSCGPGLTCTTDTSTCVAFLAQGGACGKGAPCGVGLSCVGADATKGTQGTCQADGTMVGATCDATLKTGPGCDRDAGLACNSQSKTCQTLVLAGGGQPCGTVNDQPAECASEGVCTGASGTTPGTCTASAADGAACDIGSGPACLVPARCIGSGDGGTSGTCQYAGAQSCGG
jgi:hypothetical protein